MASPQGLSRASLILKNAAPEEWENFVKEFSAYYSDVTAAVTDADASNVLIEQGGARRCKALFRIFTECELKPKP